MFLHPKGIDVLPAVAGNQLGAIVVKCQAGDVMAARGGRAVWGCAGAMEVRWNVARHPARPQGPRTGWNGGQHAPIIQPHYRHKVT
eukprot:scaffold161566_cov51-Prasinocladus_malaysianus.AAC.1